VLTAEYTALNNTYITILNMKLSLKRNDGKMKEAKRVCARTSFGLLKGCPMVLNTVSAKQASRMKQSFPSTSFSLRMGIETEEEGMGEERKVR
jgi:hypothetical protein